MDNNGQKQLSLPLLFTQFPRILILSITSRIVVDLHGKFIQHAKGENPKPMAVEGDENEETQLPPLLVHFRVPDRTQS